MPKKIILTAEKLQKLGACKNSITLFEEKKETNLKKIITFLLSKEGQLKKMPPPMPPVPPPMPPMQK